MIRNKDKTPLWGWEGNPVQDGGVGEFEDICECDNLVLPYLPQKYLLYHVAALIFH